MTLIVTCISEQYVILASDRRVTWIDNNGIPTKHEDTENKAIVLCGHFLMGYTGFAELDGMKTEQWVGDVLAEADASQYFQVLGERSQTAVARIRRDHGIEKKYSGHAFIAVGYGSLRSSPGRIEASGITISNALGESYGSWHPRETFNATRTPTLSRRNDFRIGAFGAAPSRAEMNEAVELIRRYRKHDISRVLGVCQILINLIRATAQKDKDELIGTDISVSVLPRAGVPAQDISIPVGGIKDPVSRLTCAFVPSSSNIEHAFAYTPAAVCPGMATFGGEVWTTKPPWWRQ